MQHAGAEQTFVRGVIPPMFLPNQTFDICDCKPLRVLSDFHGEPIFKPCGNGRAGCTDSGARTDASRDKDARDRGWCQGGRVADKDVRRRCFND